MKKIITLLFLGLNYCSFGQATSGPYYNLSSGPYSFTEHTSTVSLPANMQLGGPSSFNYVAPYYGDLTVDIGYGTSYAEWLPGGTGGIQIWSSVGVGGCATLFLNTLGQENINVSWTPRLSFNNAGAAGLSAQYRVGNTGNWTDIGGSATSLFDFFGQFGTPITFTLPPTCNNNADLRIRWIFQGFGPGNPDRLNLDDILVSSSGIPLPATLSSFTTNLNNNKVDIKWSTSSEKNTAIFEVEKSMDAKSWNKLISIEAAGNSDFEKNYTTTDTELFLGKMYYRLKQIDQDGKFTYSEIKNVYKKANYDIIVYPNPCSDYIQVSFGNSKSIWNIEILSFEGKVLLNEKSNSSSKKINILSLAKGSYIIRLFNDSDIITSKFEKY